jgi:hypothetical protein
MIEHRQLTYPLPQNCRRNFVRQVWPVVDELRYIGWPYNQPDVNIAVFVVSATGTAPAKPRGANSLILLQDLCNALHHDRALCGTPAAVGCWPRA